MSNKFNVKKAAVVFTILMLVAVVTIVYYKSDKVVEESRQFVGTVEGTKHCSTGPGYCMQCGLSFDGSFDCSPKFRPSCPGRQSAIFNVYEITRRHESGKISVVKTKRLKEATGKCK